MPKSKIKLRRGERGKIEIVQADSTGEWRAPFGKVVGVVYPRGDLLGKKYSHIEAGQWVHPGAEFSSLLKAARPQLKHIRSTEAHWEREYQLAKEAEKRKRERLERGGSRRRSFK